MTAAAAQSQQASLRPWTAGELPAFTLPTLDNSNVSLQVKHGRIAVVHFFATWCETCRDELPSLNRLAIRGATNIDVIAVAVADVDSRVKAMAEDTSAHYPVLLDRDRTVAKAWKVSVLPTTYLLDDSLKPRLVVESDFAWDSVNPAKLAAMLSQHDHLKGWRQSQIISAHHQEDHPNALR